MPRKPAYWTRQLELDLVKFVRQREYIWKPAGNTNHHIQQKYKAYAEFASNLGRGFTARSVRDRWVNIRTTFNHNLRRVDKSKETASSTADVYVPCWPLWKPLQFLKEVSKKEDGDDVPYTYSPINSKDPSNLEVKDESQPEFDGIGLNIRQRSDRTDRPRKKFKQEKKTNRCVKVLDDLLKAMTPLLSDKLESQQYWFFGRHVTERLNAMRDIDAECAGREIMSFLHTFSSNEPKQEGTKSYIFEDILQ